MHNYNERFCDLQVSIMDINKHKFVCVQKSFERSNKQEDDDKQSKHNAWSNHNFLTNLR